MIYDPKYKIKYAQNMNKINFCCLQKHGFYYRKKHRNRNNGHLSSFDISLVTHTFVHCKNTFQYLHPLLCSIVNR